MKLREITIRENGEYDGLEDADEFGSELAYITIGGRLPWDTKSFPRLTPNQDLDPDEIIPEVERELISLGNTLGIQHANTDYSTVGDAHGGHKQWVFYFHSEDPYQDAIRLRKLLKQNNYLTKSGQFDIDFVDVFNP